MLDVREIYIYIYKFIIFKMKTKIVQENRSTLQSMDTLSQKRKRKKGQFEISPLLTHNYEFVHLFTIYLDNDESMEVWVAIFFNKLGYFWLFYLYFFIYDGLNPGTFYFYFFRI